MIHKSKISVLCGVLAACGSFDGQVGDPITPPGVTPAARSVDVKIGPFAVPENDEVQTCFYLKVPSDTDLDLGKVIIDFAQGTHHMHVYYGDDDHADGAEECFQAVNFDRWHLLVGAQRPHLEWELPEGIAFHVKAHQQLLVQVHFVNAGTLKTADNTAQGTIHFETRDPATVVGYMGSIFGQQRSIEIGPRSEFSVDGICKLPHELSIGALAGHYHFKGSAFTAARLNADGTAEAPFYTTTDFAEPAFDLYGEDKPLRFSAGDRILWHCDYSNSTDATFKFGPRELTEEHCNMFGFYYPARGQQEFTACVSYGRCDHQCGAGETCNTQGQCVATNTCTPSCDGRSCGDDGCGGTCGACAAGSTCQAGTCQAQLTGCAATGGLESETNDTFGTASDLCRDGAIRGALARPGDLDWYAFDLRPGDVYQVTLAQLPADYTFTIYHLAASGALSTIRSAIDAHDLKDQVVQSSSNVGGRYFVKVFSPVGANAAGLYRLTMTKL